MPTSTHSLSSCSNGSSIPRPTETPPASQAPRLAASIAPGPPPVITAYPASTSRRPTAMPSAYSGSSACTRAEPKTLTAGPSSASAPKPSTNSAWIRSTLQGSECTQSLGPCVSSSRWSVVLCSTCSRRRVTGPLCVSRGRASCGAGGGVASGGVKSRAMQRRLALVGEPVGDRLQLGRLTRTEAVEEHLAHGGDVAGCRRDHGLPAVLGEHRKGPAPVGGVLVPAYPALLLQPGDRVREAAGRRRGQLGQLTHPQRAVRRLGEHGEHLVVGVRHAGVALQLAVQGLVDRRGGPQERPP